MFLVRLVKEPAFASNPAPLRLMNPMLGIDSVCGWMRPVSCSFYSTVGLYFRPERF